VGGCRVLAPLLQDWVSVSRMLVDEMSPFDKEDDDECGVTRRASGVATRGYA
jgi:hypothetical protein